MSNTNITQNTTSQYNILESSNSSQHNKTCHNLSCYDKSCHIKKHYDALFPNAFKHDKKCEEILSPNISSHEITSDNIPEVQPKSHNLHYQTLNNKNVFNAWSDWIREFEPFDWFATLTFKTDILTFAQNYPVVRRARYCWKDETGKYPNGTYVRKTEKLAWADKDNYERTGEYVNRVQEEHSERMYNRWIRKLNTEIYGKRYREKNEGMRHIYAIEYQKRGVAHLHALLKGIPDRFHRKTWERVWEGMHPNNGFCNIFPYDPELGACGYLGKYILKGGQVTIAGPRVQKASV